MPVQAAGSLHIDFIVAIDHDLGDPGIGQQRFQGPEPDRLVDHLAPQQIAVQRGGDLVVGIGDQPGQQSMGLVPQHGIAHRRDVAPAHVERVEQADVQAAQPFLGLLAGRRGGRLLADDGRLGADRRDGRRAFGPGRGAHPQHRRSDEDLVIGRERPEMGDPAAIDQCAAEGTQVFDEDPFR